MRVKNILLVKSFNSGLNIATNISQDVHLVMTNNSIFIRHLFGLGLRVGVRVGVRTGVGVGVRVSTYKKVIHEHTCHVFVSFMHVLLFFFHYKPVGVCMRVRVGVRVGVRVRVNWGTGGLGLG